MPDLLIKEAELRVLDTVIGPIPTQYGLPIVNFFQQVIQARQKEKEAFENQQKQFTEGEKQLESKEAISKEQAN